MLHIKSITKKNDISKIRSFMEDRVTAGLLFPDGFDACDRNYKYTIVSCVDFSDLPDLAAGFGQDARLVGEWLISTMLEYSRSDRSSLILVEDIVARLSDPMLSSPATPPLWTHRDRVLWPILPFQADLEYCKDILSWAAGGPQLVYFCRLIELEAFSAVSRRFSVSYDLLKSIKAAISYIITDIFDSGGYLLVSYA